MRAYTIQASGEAANVAGFVRPGNRVDVLLNLRGGSPADTGGGSTTTLLQAVEILAVDQVLDDVAGEKMDARDLRSVTLLVTPDQATLLDLGQNMGNLTLSLRNPEDLAESDTYPTTVNDIKYLQTPPDLPSDTGPLALLTAAPGEAEESGSKGPKVFQIRTLRGSQWGEVRVLADR
jgi:pilus assembly protein CpaB